MRALVGLLILIAAALGFVAGRATAPEGRGRGGGRGAAPSADAPAARGDEAPVPPETSHADEDAAVTVGGPADDVVQPTRLVNEAEEEGEHLEVDFAGFPGEHTAWVALRGMRGIEASDVGADEDGVAWFDLPPGTYEVWWFDSESARLGTRVRIGEGRVTRLRAVDYRGPAPMPEGIGFLRLDVAASWGGGLADEYVWLEDPWGVGDSIRTDGRGQVSAMLWPGRYSVDIGAHQSAFVVEGGRTTLHRIRHVREGDLVFVSDREGRVFLNRRSEPAYGAALYVGRGEDEVVPYVPEGEYEITLEGLLPLGRAKVVAGQTTRFRCDLPKGGVSVQLVKPGHAIFGRADVVVRRVVDGREAENGTNSNNRDARPVAFTLPPGRYVVRASAAEFEPAAVAIDVADTTVEVTLVLNRSR